VFDQMAASGANGLFSTTVGAAVAGLDIEKLSARRDRIMPGTMIGSRRQALAFSLAGSASTRRT
jgi:hypothetical protein